MASRKTTSQAAQTVVKLGSDYYVLASSLASRRTSRVLANGRSFAVFDAAGDIIDSPVEAVGLFNRDTRHLSRFEMLIAGTEPYFLNSYLSEDRAQFRATLTNPDLGERGTATFLPRNSIRVDRGWVLDGASLCHHVTLRSYVRAPVEIEIDFFYRVDFADVFEVRGLQRKRRGHPLSSTVLGERVELRYMGLDHTARSTEIHFDATPAAIDEQGAVFVVRLEPGERRKIECSIAASTQSQPRRVGHGAANFSV